MRLIFEWCRSTRVRRRDVTIWLAGFREEADEQLADDLRYVAIHVLGEREDVVDGTIALLLAAAERLRERR
jgi:hypothetical protein